MVKNNRRSLKGKEVTFKKSEKTGCICFYGIRRFPICIHLPELELLLNSILTPGYKYDHDFVSFMKSNDLKNEEDKIDYEQSSPGEKDEMIEEDNDQKETQIDCEKEKIETDKDDSDISSLNSVKKPPVFKRRKKISETILVGKSPEEIRHFLSTGDHVVVQKKNGIEKKAIVLRLTNKKVKLRSIDKEKEFRSKYCKVIRFLHKGKTPGLKSSDMQIQSQLNNGDIIALQDNKIAIVLQKNRARLLVRFEDMTEKYIPYSFVKDTNANSDILKKFDSSSDEYDFEDDFIDND